MTLDLRLDDTAGAVLALLDGTAIDAVDSLRGPSSEQFLELCRRVGELSRVADSLGALVASELTRRVQTDADFRRVALGGEVGGRAASELLRDLARVDDDTVRAWERVGDAITPRTSLQGEVLPAKHPAVTEAVLAADIPAGRAAVITAGLDRIADSMDAETLGGVETTLVEYAGSLTTRELRRLVRGLQDRVDPDGAEPREDWLREHSGVTIRQLPTGITRFVIDAHPESAGFVLAAIDAQTAPRRVAFSDASEQSEPTDDVTADTRTLAQKRLDAITTMARDFLAHDTGSLAGTSVTMLVTVPLEVLETGTGTAQIAGLDEPISAGTARRLAACAEIIPVVLGSESEPLDVGRSERLFTHAQRRALAVRDGGCVWPGCTAPPGWCEVAHLIAWILGGLTDLDNGALMCPHHHRRFDRDGWALRREHGVAYLIPPPWLDPDQTPRRAGRLPALAS